MLMGLALSAAITVMAIPPSPVWISELEAAGDTATINRIYKRYNARIEEHAQEKMLRMPAQTTDVGEAYLHEKGVVILVNFADLAFEDTRERMDSMLNSDNYVRDYSYRYAGTTYKVTAEGSARQYFIDQSNGAFQPQFDTYGPFTLSREQAYYGQNDLRGNDKNVDALVKEACQLAAADGLDFSKYDDNNDGYVDWVIIFYAGMGEADGGGDNCIWPHNYHYTYYNKGNLTLNGKRIDTYACFNEINATSKKLNGIGTVCHEFCHVMGLPDLYATNSSKHKTMGYWDVLDAGPYNNNGETPPAFSAYERFFFGWMKPDILNAPRSVVLPELQESNKAYMITESGMTNFNGTSPDPKEFYLIENRQKVGWDKYLPGHGMLLTKVNYVRNNWVYNSVNNAAAAMGVDIIEADGKAPSGNASGNRGKQGDAFPYGFFDKVANEYVYEADSYTPYENFPITKIRETDDQITFDFMGGSDWIGSQALEAANTGTIVYSEIIGIYDMNGNKVCDGEDFPITELTPGLYIVLCYTGDNTDRRKYKGIKMYIKE